VLTKKFINDAEEIYSQRVLLELFKKSYDKAVSQVAKERGWKTGIRPKFYIDAFPILKEFDTETKKLTTIENASLTAGKDAYRAAFRPLEKPSFKKDSYSDYGPPFLMWMCWRTPEIAESLYEKVNEHISDSEQKLTFQKLIEDEEAEGEFELIKEPPPSNPTLVPDAARENADSTATLPVLPVRVVETFKRKVINFFLGVLMALSAAALFHFGYPLIKSILEPPVISPVEQPTDKPFDKAGAPTIETDLPTDPADNRNGEGKLPTDAVAENGKTDKTDKTSPQQATPTLDQPVEMPIEITNGIWDSIPPELWTHTKNLDAFKPYLKDLNYAELEGAAMSGNANAQALLGTAIYLGDMPKYSGPEMYEKFLKQSCLSGQPLSCELISRYFGEGLAGKVNEREAHRHDNLACNYGNQVGCTDSALDVYLGTEGAPHKPAAGRSKLGKACDKNQYYEACTQLGWIYENGFYNDQDQTLADEYFAKGCELGARDRCN